MDAPIPDPAAVTLDMIKKDYVLALARLELAQSFPELQRPSKSCVLFRILLTILTMPCLQTNISTQLELSHCSPRLGCSTVHSK
jgi:hypothetical protein